MKTVYLTDLDGTLLRPDATLSKYTKDALRRLSDAGVCVGISTARTAATVSRIFSDVPLLAPASLMNGACIYDISRGEYLHAHTVDDDALGDLLDAVCGTCAFVYTVENGRLSTFYENDDEAHARRFRAEREQRYGKVFTKVPSLADLRGRGVVYMSLAGRANTLESVHTRVCAIPDLSVHYYRDIYEEDFFYLEVCAAGISKRQAADFIRAYTGADRLVGFGDNLNDLSLFEGCDEKIAVANAVPEVKAVADDVIGPNTEDSVASYILRREG